MSILRLQTASPNLKNDGFPKEILTLVKNQVFVLEDWFGSFLTLFWAHVGVILKSFWGNVKVIMGSS